MAKVKAKGVVIKYGDSAAPTTTISQLAEVSFENGQWDRVETTTHDTSGAVKTYAPTLKEPSSLDVRVLLDPAGTDHNWLIGASDSGADKYMTFVLPDAGTAQWALVGNVTNMSIGGLTPGGLVEARFTFSANQAHTYTQ